MPSSSSLCIPAYATGVYEREEDEVDPGLLQLARDALEAALAAALRPDLTAALAALDAALQQKDGRGSDVAGRQALLADGLQQNQQQGVDGGSGGGAPAGAFAYHPVAAAQRSMRAACLCMLGALRPAPPAVVADLSGRLAAADNLTDAGETSPRFTSLSASAAGAAAAAAAAARQLW